MAGLDQNSRNDVVGLSVAFFVKQFFKKSWSLMRSYHRYLVSYSGRCVAAKLRATAFPWLVYVLPGLNARKRIDGVNKRSDKNPMPL